MKIKQFSALLCALTLALSLAACGSTDSSSGAPQSSGQASASQAEEQGTAPDTQARETVYGKVTSVIGNEITLELCDAPDFMQPEMPQGEENDSSPTDGEISMPATMLTPATNGSAEQADKVDVNVDKNEPLFDPVFTGESKDFVVGAGAEYLDAAGKNRTSMNDLKEGNLVALDMTDSKVVSVLFLS